MITIYTVSSVKRFRILFEFADLFRRFELLANLAGIFKTRLAELVVYCALMWIRKYLVGLLDTTKLLARELSLSFIRLLIGMEEYCT